MNFIKRQQENGTLTDISSVSNGKWEPPAGHGDTQFFKVYFSSAILYSGRDNMISMTSDNFLDFSCHMDLMAYPFDTQVPQQAGNLS